MNCCYYSLLGLAISIACVARSSPFHPPVSVHVGSIILNGDIHFQKEVAALSIGDQDIPLIINHLLYPQDYDKAESRFAVTPSVSSISRPDDNHILWLSPGGKSIAFDIRQATPIKELNSVLTAVEEIESLSRLANLYLIRANELIIIFDDQHRHHVVCAGNWLLFYANLSLQLLKHKDQSFTVESLGRRILSISHNEVVIFQIDWTDDLKPSKVVLNGRPLVFTYDTSGLLRELSIIPGVETIQIDYHNRLVSCINSSIDGALKVSWSPTNLPRFQTHSILLPYYASQVGDYYHVIKGNERSYEVIANNPEIGNTISIRVISKKGRIVKIVRN